MCPATAIGGDGIMEDVMGSDALDSGLGGVDDMLVGCVEDSCESRRIEGGVLSMDSSVRCS